ncbi:hypothetical protein L2E82_44243 [Cichorium intybus]|uniref:Uncharacterized protein n=1 Tax=Cichorium intybus TaxID=13427 RepID=A0ACB8ZQA8_CICIN|nr:hypothetical protein L2E82_44243 [Cichorium intybus]
MLHGRLRCSTAIKRDTERISHVLQWRRNLIKPQQTRPKKNCNPCVCESHIRFTRWNCRGILSPTHHCHQYPFTIRPGRSLQGHSSLRQHHCHKLSVRALWKGLTPFATHLTLKYALRMGSNAVIQSAFNDANTRKIRRWREEDWVIQLKGMVKYLSIEQSQDYNMDHM